MNFAFEEIELYFESKDTPS